MRSKHGIWILALAIIFVAGCVKTPQPNTTSLTASGLPSWVSGKEGSVTLGIPSGTAPFRCSLKENSILPSWLTLSPDCKLSGKAPILAAGSTRNVLPNFTVSVSDSANPPLTQDISITIQIVESAPQLIPLANNQCTVNQPCTVQVATAQGGIPPYSFYSDTFRSGTPPMGMISDLNGFLTGTPKQIGTYAFGVCVKDTVSASSCGQTSVVVAAEGVAAIPAAQPAPAATPRERPTISIESGSCTVSKRYEYDELISTPIGWAIDIRGSASGSVGTKLFMWDPDYFVHDCGEWGTNCKRDEGEPSSTRWHAQGNAVPLGGYIMCPNEVCNSECVKAPFPFACQESHQTPDGCMSGGR